MAFLTSRVGEPDVVAALVENDPRLIDAQRRIARLSTEDLFSWVDVQVSGVGRAVLDMQRGGGPEHMNPADDALFGVRTLALAIEELVRRVG